MKAEFKLMHFGKHGALSADLHANRPASALIDWSSATRKQTSAVRTGHGDPSPEGPRHVRSQAGGQRYG
jgi:hypothetical protein